jgi:hypothetical protein
MTQNVRESNPLRHIPQGFQTSVLSVFSTVQDPPIWKAKPCTMRRVDENRHARCAFARKLGCMIRQAPPAWTSSKSCRIEPDKLANIGHGKCRPRVVLAINIWPQTNRGKCWCVTGKAMGVGNVLPLPRTTATGTADGGIAAQRLPCRFFGTHDEVASMTVSASPASEVLS